MVDNPIVPSANYEARYAKYNKADLCDTNFPKPKACKNPCKYKSWESWGAFKVNDPSYPADAASVTAGYPEERNKRQRMGATVFTDMKVQLPTSFKLMILMDGLYEIRYGTGATAVVQTDDSYGWFI